MQNCLKVTKVNSGEIDRSEQFEALARVARHRPLLTTGVVFGGIFAALLEGIGLSFILPIVEIVQSSGDPSAEASGLLSMFIMLYQYLSIPFTLGYVILGVSLILATRWTATFFIRWLREALVIDYTRELQDRSFNHAMDARVEYFDQEGSDDILNAIVTQAEYAGQTIRYVINFLEQGFMATLYLLAAFVLAPYLTLFAVLFLGGFTLLFRYTIESGYQIGDEVAEANEYVQEIAQAGTQGIRDAKLFNLKSELIQNFTTAVNQFAESSTTLRRNEQAIKNFYNLLTAVSVFVLIYLAIIYANMNLGALSVFLFAMFRLGPKASNMNSHFYRIENNLPHLVRMHDFILELKQNSEPNVNSNPAPQDVNKISFDEVYFSYSGQEDRALSGISYEINKNEFVGFVGRSGAGKSTVVSLLARMYSPDKGTISVNGCSIHKMGIDQWREKVAVVQQDPFIFNDTLRYNLTIGNRNIPDEKMEKICEIAKVKEFAQSLPSKYETQLGDDGVRLSGGQKQRVALARALLKDSDILILDEATSDLDSNLEKQVQSSIEGMEEDYIMIGIAHRLSTIENADKIYTIQDGEIIESGTHEELLERGRQYAELYSIQSQSQGDKLPSHE